MSYCTYTFLSNITFKSRCLHVLVLRIFSHCGPRGWATPEVAKYFYLGITSVVAGIHYFSANPSEVERGSACSELPARQTLEMMLECFCHLQSTVVESRAETSRRSPKSADQTLSKFVWYVKLVQPVTAKISDLLDNDALVKEC
jgi:hypothetical protein